MRVGGGQGRAGGRRWRQSGQAGAQQEERKPTRGQRAREAGAAEGPQRGRESGDARGPRKRVSGGGKSSQGTASQLGRGLHMCVYVCLETLLKPRMLKGNSQNVKCIKVNSLL